MKGEKSKIRSFYKRDSSMSFFVFCFLIICFSLLAYAVWVIPHPADIFAASTLTDLSQFIGAEVGLLTLAYAALNLRNEHVRLKRARSSWYVQKWYSFEADGHIVDTKKLRERIDKANTKEKSRRIYEKEIETWKESRPHDVPLRRKLNTVLNLFEQMGQEVKFGVADEEYLKDFFFYIVVKNYDSFRLLINSARERREVPELYCNFEALAKYWVKRGPPCPPDITGVEWPTQNKGTH